jgi:siroheme synthase (precorrin-2 oxidase/ferrochelatase)
MAQMPQIVPGGKIDSSLISMTTGVIKELEPQYRRHKEEEERIREELKTKQEKLRKNLRIWDRLERESKAFELKSDLSEKSLKTIAGEGLGGAAF